MTTDVAKRSSPVCPADAPWNDGGVARWLECVRCQARFELATVRYRCDCGGGLDLCHDLAALDGTELKQRWNSRWGARRGPDASGVWRYREIIMPAAERQIVTKAEGNTRLHPAGRAGEYAGLSDFWLKHEGDNPTGSFKDRGMTCGVTAARIYGATAVACASTGNTSASMAAYAVQCGLRPIVFIPAGKIAYGKLAQALAYGALTLQIEGNFDDAMTLVQEVCRELGIYLLNSINPFRIEGQKAIGFEVLQQLDWEPPDWFVIPGGNLGNNTALSKGLQELHQLGLLSRIPRLAVIQAAGANPLYRMWRDGTPFAPVPHPETIATAIKIGNPVSWEKSLRGLAWCQGVVAEVNEQEIMDAKAMVDAAGIGAEPASCCTVAGAKKLVAEGIIPRDAKVVGILTGNLLKDPDAVIAYHQDRLGDHGIRGTYANAPRQVAPTLAAVREALADGTN